MDDEAAEFLAQDAVTLRASGKSVRDIARLLGCSRRDVEDALDEHAKRCLTPQNRARLIGSELATLDAMSEPFIKAAKAGDHQAAIVVLKIQTRRACLLGLDAPIRHDPIELIASSEPKLNSTQQIERALDDFMAQDKQALRNGGAGYGDWRDDRDREILARRAARDDEERDVEDRSSVAGDG